MYDEVLSSYTFIGCKAFNLTFGRFGGHRPFPFGQSRKIKCCVKRRKTKNEKKGLEDAKIKII